MKENWKRKNNLDTDFTFLCHFVFESFGLSITPFSKKFVNILSQDDIKYMNNVPKLYCISLNLKTQQITLFFSFS